MTLILAICSLWFLSGLLVGGVVVDKITERRHERDELIERRLRFGPWPL